MKSLNNIFSLIKKPQAVAKLQGSPKYPGIKGTAEFYQTKYGVIVSVFVQGLPTSTSLCEKPIFAMHIHSGNYCSGDEKDFFADALTHFNPYNCPHPYHSGDMPPLFGANGTAISIFLTDRLSVKEIIGKTIIIHSNPDDFTTQPSGNSGEKIACGKIEKE